MKRILLLTAASRSPSAAPARPRPRGPGSAPTAASPTRPLTRTPTPRWRLPTATASRGRPRAPAPPPLWAGVIALADQAAGRHLGFVNPAIYQIARGAAYRQAFHDVVTGDKLRAVAHRALRRVHRRARLGPGHRLGQPRCPVPGPLARPPRPLIKKSIIPNDFGLLSPQPASPERGETRGSGQAGSVMALRPPGPENTGRVCHKAALCPPGCHEARTSWSRPPRLGAFIRINPTESGGWPAAGPAAW